MFGDSTKELLPCDYKRKVGTFAVLGQELMIALFYAVETFAVLGQELMIALFYAVYSIKQSNNKFLS